MREGDQRILIKGVRRSVVREEWIEGERVGGRSGPSPSSVRGNLIAKSCRLKSSCHQCIVLPCITNLPLIVTNTP